MTATKDRLLRAACEIFAEKGYRDTTVAEICKAADANIAAVNYHFGDKSNLYCEVFRHLFEVVRQAYPEPDPQTTSPEEWLRGFVRSRVGNILDEGEAGLLPKLMYHEMGQPTETHRYLHDELFRPRRKTVIDMVHRFLGDEVEEEELRTAMINFSSLHIFLNVGKQKARKSKLLRETHPCGKVYPRDLATQVEHFAMGGLLATKHYLATKKATQ